MYFNSLYAAMSFIHIRVHMMCAGIFIEFDPFRSNSVLRGGVDIREGGARYHLSLLPYFFFESMYRHVYGVKLSNCLW